MKPRRFLMLLGLAAAIPASLSTLGVVGAMKPDDLRDAPAGASPLGHRTGPPSGAVFVETSDGEKIAVDAENNVYYRDLRGRFKRLSTVGELLAAGNSKVDETLKRTIAKRRAIDWMVFLAVASLSGFLAYLAAASLFGPIRTGTHTRTEGRKLRWLAGERARLIDGGY